MADARLELEDAAVAGPANVHTVRQTEDVRPVSHSLYKWSAAVAFMALMATLVAWSPWKTSIPRASVRLTSKLGADVSLVNQGSSIALSPDGGILAFVAPETAVRPKARTVAGDGCTQYVGSTKPILFARQSRGFDLHPDGERIAFAPAQESAAARQVVFVFNFLEELKRLVPTN